MPPKAEAKGVAALAKAKAAAAGKDANFYEEEVALAVPGEWIEAVVQDASGALRGRAGMPPKARAKGAAARAKAETAAAGKD